MNVDSAVGVFPEAPLPNPPVRWKKRALLGGLILLAVLALLFTVLVVTALAADPAGGCGGG